jgi:hypothetical protein
MGNSRKFKGPAMCKSSIGISVTQKYAEWQVHWTLKPQLPWTTESGSRRKSHLLQSSETRAGDGISHFWNRICNNQSWDCNILQSCSESKTYSSVYTDLCSSVTTPPAPQDWNPQFAVMERKKHVTGRVGESRNTQHRLSLQTRAPSTWQWNQY